MITINNRVADSKTILIVEDDEAIRESLSIWLTDFGWTVKAAESAAKALEFEKPFDTYIIDQNLKDREGFSLVEELWSRYGRVPVIIMSGYLDKELRNDALSRGVVGILKKPFHLEEINRILASIHKKKRGG